MLSPRGCDLSFRLLFFLTRCRRTEWPASTARSITKRGAPRKRGATMPTDEEAERWLEKRVNPTPSRMDEAIRSLACVAQRRPNPDRRVSIPGAGAPAPRSPKRAGLPDAQGIADAVLVSGAAATSNEEAAWLSAGSPAAPVGAACLGLPKLWPTTAGLCQPMPASANRVRPGRTYPPCFRDRPGRGASCGRDGSLLAALAAGQAEAKRAGCTGAAAGAAASQPGAAPIAG